MMKKKMKIMRRGRKMTKMRRIIKTKMEKILTKILANKNPIHLLCHKKAI